MRTRAKNITVKNRQKILFSVGILLLSLAFIPFVREYRDFFLFAGIIFLLIGVIQLTFHPKVVYRDLSETGSGFEDAKQTTQENPVLKMPFSMKQSPMTLFLFFLIIGGFIINQVFIMRYNKISASKNVENTTPVQSAVKVPVVSAADEIIKTELQQQGKEVPVLGTAHDHADLNVYINGQRQILAKPENYMKSSFMHIDNNPNLDDANSVLHMHAKSVLLWTFFTSLGMNLTQDSLTLTDGQILKNENGNTLKFYLNGQKVDELGDYSFQPLDKMLISYGPENDPNVQEQLRVMTNFAKDHQK